MSAIKELLPHEVSGSPVDATERIKQILATNKKVLFMKGNADMPRCGFSANSIKILSEHNQELTTYDILKDPELRQAIKEFSDWPTFPQFYVSGELLGGNDILTELNEKNELASALG